MEIIFRICLFIAGVINFIPSFLAFLPSNINKSYGIEIPNADYELLLRHRAILFGIVGGIMIYGAITKKNYYLAFVIGCISMVSFILLSYLVSSQINSELFKVLKIDVVGLAILIIGFILFRLK